MWHYWGHTGNRLTEPFPLTVIPACFAVALTAGVISFGASLHAQEAPRAKALDQLLEDVRKGTVEERAQMMMKEAAVTLFAK